VGFCEVAPLSLLPPILTVIGDQEGAAFLSLEDVDSLDSLRKGRVDLAFASLPLPAGPFDYVVVSEERYVLAGPPDLLRGVQVTKRRDLSGVPLVFHSTSAMLRALQVDLVSAGCPLNIVQSADSEKTVRAFAEAGIGAAVLPESSVRSIPTVTTIDLSHVLAPHTVLLVWHRHRRLGPTAARFRAAVAAVIDTVG
jgi:DNA-binding transcriptional LysR family regulator